MVPPKEKLEDTEFQSTPEDSTEQRKDKYFKRLDKSVNLHLKTSRSRVLKYMIVFNIVYAILYGLCRYVVQVDYSSFDMSGIESKLAKFQSKDVCLNYDKSVTSKTKTKITNMFEKMNVPQDKSIYDEDSKHLKFFINENVEKCFKINISHDENIQNSGLIQIISKDEIKLVIQKSVNKFIQSEISNVAQYLGHAPFGLKYFNPDVITQHKFKTVQATLFFNNQVKDGAQIKSIRNQVEEVLKEFCVFKVKMVSHDQVIVKEKFVSEKSTDLVASQSSSQVLIDSEKLNHYLGEESVLNQYHMEDTNISLTKYGTRSENFNIVFFVQPDEGIKQFAIKDKSTSTYSSWSKVHQNRYASTITLGDQTKNDIAKFVSNAIRGSLRIPSVKDLADASIRNDVKINDLRDQTSVSDIKTYFKNQVRLENIETLKNFQTIIKILQNNYLESADPLYKGLNLHELARDVRDDLTEYQIEMPVKKETKVKVGVLYETKEMNPPYFFSIEFTLGTYGPFAAPFIITLFQMLFATLKQK